MDKTNSYEQIYLLNVGFKASEILLKLDFNFNSFKLFDSSRLKFKF